MLRLISRNHKCLFPRYLVFVDTESNIAKEDINRYSEHSLKLGVAIYVQLDKNANVIKREVFRFYIAYEFWDWVANHTLKQNTLIIYGHNLKYDAINLSLLDELQRLNYTIPYPILNNKFIMSVYRDIRDKKCYKIKLVDTFNFTQFSLKEIGKRFGIEKLEADFLNDNDETLFTYCERDTQIVETFVTSYIKFLVENDLGSFKDTLASTSYSVYRHAFLEEIWSHDDLDLLAFERDSYFGGRTECWYIGKLPKQDYYIYDVRSMYPYIMKHKKLPNKPIGIIENPSIELVKSYIKDDKYVIAECIIRANEKLLPYPVRHDNIKTDEFPYASTLLFPKGEFKTFLHLPELQYAIQHNHIVSFVRIAVYEQSFIFSKFVDYFYDRKSNSTNKVERELSKLTMNSTYGAMAKRHYHTDDMDIPDNVIDLDCISINLKMSSNDLGYAIVKDNNKRQTYHAWLGKLYRVTADGLTPVNNGNVAIAASITAYARMYLFEMLVACGDKHCYYSDTDSILTDRIGSTRLKKYVSDNLGGLELQLQFNGGIINCPKDYEFKTITNILPETIRIRSTKIKPILNITRRLVKANKVRLKGVSRLSQKIGVNEFSMVRFTSIKDYIRTGKHGTIVLDKKLKRIYNKGIIGNDHFVSSPTMKYELGENIRYV